IRTRIESARAQRSSMLTQQSRQNPAAPSGPAEYPRGTHARRTLLLLDPTPYIAAIGTACAWTLEAGTISRHCPMKKTKPGISGIHDAQHLFIGQCLLIVPASSVQA